MVLLKKLTKLNIFFYKVNTNEYQFSEGFQHVLYNMIFQNHTLRAFLADILDDNCVINVIVKSAYLKILTKKLYLATLP